MRTACAELRARGYMCDRMAHRDVMTSTGTQYFAWLFTRGLPTTAGVNARYVARAIAWKAGGATLQTHPKSYDQSSGSTYVYYSRGASR
eukprot:2063291-Pyramimonas_sp.AAC.1